MKLFLIAATQLRIGIIASVLLLSSCKKENLPEPADENLTISIPVEWNVGASNQRTNMTTASFSAIAAIQYCWGENVRFFGTIENKVNTTTDGNGIVHYNRHWIIKGLSATGLGATSATTDDTPYTLIAGAEMFTVKDPEFNLTTGALIIGSGTIFIHQGTVVLENNATGKRVVARHVIKKHPQTGEVTSGWYCMGK